MAAPDSDSYDAFLSYAHEDGEVARAVRSALGERGVEVFVDELIEPGQAWVGALESALSSGAAFLVLLSEASQRSYWVELETQAARVEEYAGKPIEPYPLWLSGDLRDAPLFLRVRQAVDLRFGIDAPDFGAKMDSLATAIQKKKPARLAATVLDSLGFLAFFPQGMPQPVFRALVADRDLEAALRTATAKRAIVERAVDGAPLVGLDLSVLPWVQSMTADSGPSVREVLQQVERALCASDPYQQDGPLSPSLVLLLRDELRLLHRHEVASGDDDDDWLDLRDEILWRAREAWPDLLADEGRLAIALEIMRARYELEEPGLLEALSRAQLNLRLGAPDRALDMFDMLSGGNLFDDERLSPADRIATIQDWAKAAKDAGEGRPRHDDLLEAYQVAIDLTQQAYSPGKDRELARADLLTNRATQLTVFGDRKGDLDRADADLEAAAQVYRQLGEDEYLLELEAERLSLALHRLAPDAVPDEQLLAEVDRVQELADDADATYGLFFFHYMKGTIHGRAGDAGTALGSFETAEQVARHRRLESPATLARWKVLRLQLKAGTIDRAQFLNEIDACKARLLAHLGDAWSTNALLKILIDDVRPVALVLGRRDTALAATAEAFDLSVRRAAGRTATALRKVRGMRDRINELNPDAKWRKEFITSRKEALARLMQVSSWKVGWARFKDW